MSDLTPTPGLGLPVVMTEKQHSALMAEVERLRDERRTYEAALSRGRAAEQQAEALQRQVNAAASLIEDRGPLHTFDCDRFQTYGYGTRQGKCDCNLDADLMAALSPAPTDGPPHGHGENVCPGHHVPHETCCGPCHEARRPEECTVHRKWKPCPRCPQSAGPAPTDGEGR